MRWTHWRFTTLAILSWRAITFLVMAPILICTDLDRTLLPNGPQSESPGARPLLARIVGRPEVSFAFVSGRRLALHEEAIAEYNLPMPRFIVADVGATIWRRENDRWTEESTWHEKLAVAWENRTWREILPTVADISGLELQEEEAQSAHKLSFNVPVIQDRERILTEVHRRLDAAGIPAQLIWSVDETVPMGLLDVMAPGANKHAAVEHVIRISGVPRDRVLYAGDSGNDLPMLVSDLASVLVAEFRQEAKKEAGAAGHAHRLHIAAGSLPGLNGCYSAGILEGLVHFFPETRAWLERP